MYSYSQNQQTLSTYNLNLEHICQPDILNLFSDASMKHRGSSFSSCYGSVAVTGDRTIEDYLRIQSDTTVPAAELRGIRCSLILALKYKDYFRVINLFSDSQLSVYTLREYIYNWKYDPSINNYRTRNCRHTPVVNIELILECFDLLQMLRREGKIINIYHQSGHVDNGYENIAKAATVFKASNNIQGDIDFDLIRYISIYNNYIDNKTRNYLSMAHTNTTDNWYHDPIKYIPNGNLYTIRGEQK